MYEQHRHSDAERILLAILQENGGSYNGKVRLWKVFYDAHLMYWKTTGKILTSQRIVQMPNGPGIDDGDDLLAALVAEGRLIRKTRSVGPYAEDIYHLPDSTAVYVAGEEKHAIGCAIAWVGDKTAVQISKESHERSRSWREAGSGDELAIYVDALTEHENDRKTLAADRARAFLDDAE